MKQKITKREFERRKEKKKSIKLSFLNILMLYFYFAILTDEWHQASSLSLSPYFYFCIFLKLFQFFLIQIY
jgi:hypothetical protein